MQEAEQPVTVNETAVWAWSALIAAAVVDVSAAFTVTKGGEAPKEPAEPEPETRVRELHA